MRENMGRCLESLSSPVFWSFTPEKLQDSDEVTEYLKGKRCGCSKEAQFIALCWALAGIYQSMLDIMQHPQGEERENRPKGAAATPTLMTSTAATPALARGTAAEPENQPGKRSLKSSSKLTLFSDPIVNKF